MKDESRESWRAYRESVLFLKIPPQIVPESVRFKVRVVFYFETTHLPAASRLITRLVTDLILSGVGFVPTDEGPEPHQSDAVSVGEQRRQLDLALRRHLAQLEQLLRGPLHRQNKSVAQESTGHVHRRRLREVQGARRRKKQKETDSLEKRRNSTARFPRT